MSKRKVTHIVDTVLYTATDNGLRSLCGRDIEIVSKNKYLSWMNSTSVVARKLTQHKMCKSCMKHPKTAMMLLSGLE